MWAELIIGNVAEVFGKFDISTPLRQVAFLAQMGHESGLKPIQENLNYSADRLLVVFPKYFTKETVQTYARKPELIANRVYESRMGNGPEASGDGYRFRGRGWIQLTGRGSYRACGQALGQDIENAPDLLLDGRWAALSAGWFWNSRNLNPLADKGDFMSITRAINGGLNGYDHRLKLYEAGKAVMGIS